MRKLEELSNPLSCMSRAKNSEMTFVLLGRDKAAPAVIRLWANMRINMGLNSKDDDQIKEAFRCAEIMEEDRGKIG